MEECYVSCYTNIIIVDVSYFLFYFVARKPPKHLANRAHFCTHTNINAATAKRCVLCILIQTAITRVK